MLFERGDQASERKGRKVTLKCVLGDRKISNVLLLMTGNEVQLKIPGAQLSPSTPYSSPSSDMLIALKNCGFVLDLPKFHNQKKS